MEKPGTLFPRSFGSFLFPLLATMHAGEGAGETNPHDTTTATAAAAASSPPADRGNKPPATGVASAAAATADGNGGVTGGGAWGGGGRAVRSPDERLALVARSYGRAMCELAGTPDPEGHALLQAALADPGSGEGSGEARGGRDQKGPAGRRGGQGEAMGARGADGGGVVGGVSPRRGGGGDGGAGGGDLTELMEKTRCVVVSVVRASCAACFGFAGCVCIVLAFQVYYFERMYEVSLLGSLLVRLSMFFAVRSLFSLLGDAARSLFSKHDITSLPC